MSDPVETKVEVDPGAIIVVYAHIIAKDGDVAAIDVDLHSKYADLACTGSADGVPLVCLEASAETLKVDEVKRGKPTAIRFVDFPGWHIHCASLGRYTLSVCLVRLEPEHE